MNELDCVESATRRKDVHSHFLQEDLSARVVSGSIVSKCQNVIGPVLMYVQPETENKGETSNRICVQKRLKSHQDTTRGQ